MARIRLVQHTKRQQLLKVGHKSEINITVVILLGEKINIEKERLKELFIDKNLTIVELSEAFNCSTPTIVRNIRRFGLQKKQLTSISRDQIYEMYIVNKMTIKEISKTINKSDQYVKEKLKEFGFRLSDMKYKIELTDKQHDLIIGSILGDGCLRTDRSGSYYLSIGHSPQQEEYCRNKFKVLSNLCKCKDVSTIIKSDGYKTIQFVSKRLECFGEYLNYSKKDLIDNLNSNSLTIWYLDDGYYSPRNKTYSIGMTLFTLEEMGYLLQSLKNKFNINATITNTSVLHKNGRHNGIYIKRDSAERMRDLFLKSDFAYMFNGAMNYKLGDF